MDNQYILTFDCGTTAVKAALVRFDGSVVCSTKAEYPLIQPYAGWAEQDPEVLWQAVCSTSKVVIKEGQIDPNALIAVVFVAPWKNIIPIDRDGNVLRNSIIWMDARAAEQAARLNETLGSFLSTGQEYWPRLMWVKEKEPEIWAKADKILGLNTYFKWRATGEIATEPSDDFIHAYNPRMQEKYNKILKAAGLDEDVEKFPPLRLSTDEVGKVTPKAAAELGLVVGIPVFGGFGDLPAITIGTGCCKTGMVHSYFGTSSWMVDVLHERKEEYSPQYFTFDPTHEGAMFALQTGCLAYDWVLDQCYHAERQLLGDGIYTYMDNELADIPAGSDNLIATHWLNGELPPLAKNAKALFFNLTTTHTRRHMAHAMMECICYTHRRYLDRYEQFNLKKLPGIRVVGGGATSDIWMQMLADVLQIPVEVPENPRYAGTIGAYYCAMVGLGHLDNYDAIYDAVRIKHVYQPQKENAKIYDKLYNIYLKLYPTLRELYGEINGVY